MAKRKRKSVAKSEPLSMSQLRARQDALIQSIADILFRTAKQNAANKMGDENCWNYGIVAFYEGNIVPRLFYHEQYFDYQFFDEFHHLLMAIREFKRLTCANSHKPWITCQFVIANQGGRFKILYDYDDKASLLDIKLPYEMFLKDIYCNA